MNEIAVVFGDVHGESGLLERLITEARNRYGPDVAFYSVGDLVDRGPDSAGVIELCVQYNVQGILGNHELWLHQLFMGGKFWKGALSPAMAGDRTLLSYGCTDYSPQGIKEFVHQFPEHHKEFIKRLPVWRKFTVGKETFRLIHGGMKQDDARIYQDQAEHLAGGSNEVMGDFLCDLVASVEPDRLLWTGPRVRSRRAQPNLYHFPESTQIFGHIPLKAARVTKKWIGLDTGCGTCDPKMLTGIVLPSRELITIQPA